MGRHRRDSARKGLSASRDGAVAVLARLTAPLVYGWREAFVPLVVIAHSQHGWVLATAGVAVAAVRLGDWIYGRVSVRRPSHQAAIIAAIALAMLGMVPEEGPLTVLLWCVFGLAWPLIRERLTAGGVLPGAATGWLLLGMALAGPLALGPGTWLIAAGMLSFAWFWRDETVVSASAPGPRSTMPNAGTRAMAASTWLPVLYSLAYLAWSWLMPAQLLAAGLPFAWCGAAFAAAWLFREPGLRAAEWMAGRMGLGRTVALAALALVPVTVGLSHAGAPWQLVMLLGVHGFCMGLVSADPVVTPPQRMTMLGPGQAAGEVLGPLLGVVILALGGASAVLLAGAVLAGAMAVVAVLGGRMQAAM